MSGSVEALFDTNIVIDALNGYREAQHLIKQSYDPAISVITWMEVMAGTQTNQESSVRAALAEFTNLNIDDEIKERAVQLRRVLRLKLPDAIILATAQITGRTLYTRNSRDFIEGPGVQVPYKL